MTKPRAVFIELKVQNKFRHACDVIEKLYDNQITVIVYVDDKKKAATLDRLLWVWKQESFIPHIFKETYSPEIVEPVFITTDVNTNMAADALILFDPITDQQFSQFRFVIDFAEVYDKSLIEKSRERFKLMRASELYEMGFFKLGEFLSKHTFA